MTPTQSLRQLQEGNRRFVAGQCTRNVSRGHEWCAEPFQDKSPVAIVLGCSDARVPLELIFDQAFGALFLVRVAGSVAAPTQIGSIEFAVERFSTPLVVVLGHDQCGAVATTVADTVAPAEALSPNLEVIAGLIRPAVRQVMNERPDSDLDAWVDAAVGVCVRDTVARLNTTSRILQSRIEQGALKVVGAQYSLRTGAVEFFE